MTGRYKTYSAYKNSNVEWVGKIPCSWSMHKLAHSYEGIGSGTTPPTDFEEWYEGNIPWVTTGELRETVIEDTKKKLSESTLDKFPTLKKYPVGSVAIAMYGATIGRLGIFGIEATTNQACCVLPTSKKMNNKYVFYWLMAFKDEIVRLSSGGGQPNINQEKVASLKISAPEIGEQLVIADFLDHETAKIDTLIAKQEKLIELLKEKRQAVISHAVTKGLNPNAPMKDSGVEWLGVVPEHWTIVPIKQLAELTPKKSQISGLEDRECSFVPMEKLKQDRLVLDESRKLKEVYNGYTYFENEDILLAKVTPCFENKNMVIARNLVNGIGFGSSEIYVIRCTAKVYNEFLYFRLQESLFMNFAIASMSGAGGLKRVPSDVITNFTIALPALHEQLLIIDAIKRKISRIDDLLDKANVAIGLIKERKSALISAAVTGKIDVRDWQGLTEAKY